MSEQPNGTLRWGVSPTLTALETVMWRADVSRTTRSTALAVEILDTEPDWDRLVAAHEWGVRRVPRLSDRVLDPLGAWTAPTWIRDPHFDVHYHLRRARLRSDGSLAELFTLASQMAMTPFDRTRPPWEALLVEGLPDGEAAYLLKFHHALSDGLGMTDLLSTMHSHQRAPTPDKPQPAPTVGRAVGVVDVVAAQARRDVGALTGVIRGGGAAVAKLLRDPVAAASGVAGYLASARRVLSPPEASGLEPLVQRGGSWAFVALDVQFSDLRAAAKTAGGTLNDAFLAALLGAFRSYVQDVVGPLPDDAVMPVSVPVSLRDNDDPAGGNHFAPARLAAPVGISDPAQRIALVGRQMRAARAEPALESAELIGPVLARLPGSLLAPLAGSMTSSNDLQASNVPGSREDLYLAGARIERIYPFAPLPGCAAMICLHTYRDVCCVGANLDSAAITDPAAFARCLREGFAEVLHLSPDAVEPEVIT